MSRPEETPRAAASGRESGHAHEGQDLALAGERRKRFGPEFIPLNLSAPFIRRPVATTLLTIAVTLAGMVAFFLLPVAPLPEVDFPVVRVQANMPGASPETMASTVATPLERVLGRIAGVTEMTSSSSLGSTRVILQFDLDRDINGAARDVQAAINAARSTLPTMPSNPTYRKVNPSGAPILILSVTSDVLSRTQLYDAASTVLAQKISQIAGVGEVTVGGGALPAVRVDISPDALHRTGLSMEDVRAALAGANAFLPKGHLENESTSWTVVASDQLRTAAQYRKVIVAERGGVVIRLGDVATVTDSSQDIRQMALSNGKPSILLIVFRSPGANIIETVDRVKAMIPQLRSWLPESADLSVRMDRSQTIRASLHEVEKSLLLSMALVVLVVFLFLRNGRATSIPAVAAPVSLIGTFGVMYLCGYTLDNLSLMALTVATGFVVDDAIVVLENIVRRLEMGEKPLRAALRGAREVGFTVISISLSLVAVFIPILFMGGVVGRLFREFSVVLATAVLVSMVVSLTTTPMMCATLLRPFDEELARRSARLRAEEGGRQGLFTHVGRLWGRFLSAMQEGYSRSLYVVLDHWKLTLTVLLLVVAANVWMYVVVPKGFFPQQDTGVIMGGIRADQSASFQDMEVKLARLGLTMKDVDAALNNAFGQRQVSTIYEEKNQYRVVLEYALPWLEGEDSLGKVWLPGKEGAVPLLGVAEVSPAFAPLSVAHQGQFAAVTLSFNLAEGASLSQAQAAIDEARVRIGMPSTIVGSFQGTAKMYSDTVREQVLLILAALAALYIVLGVLYESLIHPLTILSTLPSAGIGALLALRACGMEFSVIALIGVLLLCGIVKKNAIMMIDFAIEAARTRNLPPREAIHEACRLRFRPIMMTTAAAILGAVPLALGQGDGAEIRQPLGITIVGGLLVSQLLTLYTTPVVYLCLDRARLRWRRRWWRLRYGERKAALLTALCRQG